MKFTFNVTTFLVLITLIVVLVFGCNQCRNQKVVQPAKQTVVVKLDTNWLRSFIIKAIQSRPVLVGSGQTPASILEKKTIYQIDTTATKQFISAQYAKLVDAFLKSNYYRDTLRIGNMGYVALNDTIQQNSFNGRGYTYDINQREITKTVTITNPPERKNKMFVYGGVEANKVQPLKGLGVRAGVMFQNRNDEAISVGLSQWPGYANQFDVNYYHKIGFRKKK